MGVCRVQKLNPSCGDRLVLADQPTEVLHALHGRNDLERQRRWPWYGSLQTQRSMRSGSVVVMRVILSTTAHEASPLRRSSSPSKIFLRPTWPFAAASSRWASRVGRNSIVVTKNVQLSQMDSKWQSISTGRAHSRCRACAGASRGGACASPTPRRRQGADGAGRRAPRPSPWRGCKEKLGTVPVDRLMVNVGTLPAPPSASTATEAGQARRQPMRQGEGGASVVASVRDRGGGLHRAGRRGRGCREGVGCRPHRQRCRPAATYCRSFSSRRVREPTPPQDWPSPCTARASHGGSHARAGERPLRHRPGHCLLPPPVHRSLAPNGRGPGGRPAGGGAVEGEGTGPGPSFRVGDANASADRRGWGPCSTRICRG
jgi:hypothetical protein